MLLIHLSVVSSSAVIHEPTDVATIESALLAAAPYDTVIVAPGTYFVNLEWPATPGIKLLSSTGPAIRDTTVDQNEWVHSGGGPYASDTSFGIRGCWIQDNSTQGSGGAVWLLNAGGVELRDLG